MHNARALLITYDFPPLTSGISTYLYNIGKRLPQSEYHILAPACTRDDAGDPFSGMAMHYYPTIKNALLRALVLLPYALRVMSREKIRVVFCAVPVSIGVIGLLGKNIFNIPYCIFYYGGEFAKYRRSACMMRILRAVLRHSTRVIAISDFTAEEVASYGIEREKIIKITPGVDTTVFREGLDCGPLRKRLRLEGERVLLTVGRLVKRKGIDSVIRALPAVRKEFPQTTYLIVGDGPERENLQGLVQENSLSHAVLFLGSVSSKELPYYYNLCDCYVMPNRDTKGDETREGFGISFIEASACAKAVVAGRSGGVADAVKEGVTGIMVDPKDTVAIGEALIRLLRDDEYRLMLGRQGRLRAAQEFNWQSRSEKIIWILEQSIKNSTF